MLAVLFVLYCILTTVLSVPPCRYVQPINGPQEFPTDSCQSFINPGPNMSYSLLYKCNGTGNGVDIYSWSTNIKCEGAPDIKVDVTDDIYRFDCNLPLCTNSYPLVSWQIINNCTNIDYPNYFNLTAITNDCAMWNGTNSGILKCGNHPLIVSYEVYYNNTKCQGDNMEQVILHNGCNDNTTYDRLFNCTVPTPILVLSVESLDNISIV